MPGFSFNVALDNISSPSALALPFGFAAGVALADVTVIFRPSMSSWKEMSD
jgi:hypothetical protein